MSRHYSFEIGQEALALRDPECDIVEVFPSFAECGKYISECPEILEDIKDNDGTSSYHYDLVWVVITEVYESGKVTINDDQYNPASLDMALDIYQDTIADTEEETITEEENTMVNTITIRLTLTDEAYYSYNSKSIEPNNWVCCPATDDNGTPYKCYYHIEDGTELEDVDYYAPDCIVNEGNGKTVELDFVEIV